MRPNLNKNLSLPWTPRGEKASVNHQIPRPRKKATSLKIIPGALYQFVDLVDRAVVTDS